MNAPLVENFTPMPRPIEYSTQLEEVAADHRLAAADVDVEDLQVVQLVEHRLGLGGGQLARVAPARRRQAVHALQVAGVGQLPREADRRVEPALQLLNQR